MAGKKAKNEIEITQVKDIHTESREPRMEPWEALTLKGLAKEKSIKEPGRMSREVEEELGREKQAKERECS